MENNLADLLFGRTRRGVLSLLLTHPDESFHLRDIQRRTGASIAPLHGELKKLTVAGLVERRQRGRQVFFQANRQSQVFPELQSLIIKTAGIADVLRRCLLEAGLTPKIVTAFIFGSVARSGQSAASDVDIMVIGSPTFADVAAALHDAQQILGREVNPTVYNLPDWRKKLRQRHPFLSRVMAERKIFLIGDAHELEAMAGQRHEEGSQPAQWVSQEAQSKRVRCRGHCLADGS